MYIGIILTLLSIIFLFCYSLIQLRSYNKILVYAASQYITSNYFANVMDVLIVEFKDLLIEKYSLNENISNSEISKIIFENIKDSLVFNLPIKIDDSILGKVIEEQLRDILYNTITK